MPRRFLEKEGIFCDLVDLRTLSPLDWETVFASVRRTGRLLALDTSNATGSVAGEIVARVSMECFAALRCAPMRIALSDVPSPTSPALTKGFYQGAQEIVQAVALLLNKDISIDHFQEHRKRPHDVPGDWFKGPF